MSRATTAWIAELQRRLAPLLLTLQIPLGLASLQGAPALGYGLHDIPAVPFLIGVVVLEPGQMQALAISTSAWFVMIGLAGLRAAGGQPLAVLGWIGFRLFAIACCVIHVKQRHEQDSLALQTLQTQQAQLQQSLQISLRSSALVHELRQPLAVLLLQARELLHHLPTDPTALRSKIATLQLTAEQINCTIDAIGALLSTANRSRQEPIDLSQIVSTAIGRVEEQLYLHGISLERTDIPAVLELPGNAMQLQIALDNLLGNAVDAVKEQPAGQRKITVQLTRGASHARLRIADSGSGLPSSDLDALQLNSSKLGGLGLGLYIVALVAANHDGTLTAGVSPRLGGAELSLSLGLAATR